MQLRVHRVSQLGDVVRGLCRRTGRVVNLPMANGSSCDCRPWTEANTHALTTVRVPVVAITHALIAIRIQTCHRRPYRCHVIGATSGIKYNTPHPPRVRVSHSRVSSSLNISSLPNLFPSSTEFIPSLLVLLDLLTSYPPQEPFRPGTLSDPQCSKLE